MNTKKVYAVITSRNGAGSENRFSSYSEAARFAKYLLNDGYTEVKIAVRYMASELRP